MVKLRNILAYTAAAGLVIAPVAASAGTRPADSASSLAGSLNLSLASAPLPQGRIDDDDDNGGGFLMLFAGLGIAALVALVMMGDASEEGGSPGTGA